MKSLQNYYRGMRPEAKQAFWVSVTNICLVIFTFWMGLYVQDAVANKNVEYGARMARIEYMDKYLPALDTLTSKYYKQYVLLANVIDMKKANAQKDAKGSFHFKEPSRLIDLNYNALSAIPENFFFSVTRDSLLSYCKDVLKISKEYSILFVDNKERTEYFQNSKKLCVLLFLYDLMDKHHEQLSTDKIKELTYSFFFSSEWMKSSGGIIANDINSIVELVTKMYETTQGLGTSSPSVVLNGLNFDSNDDLSTNKRKMFLIEPLSFLSSPIGMNAYVTALSLNTMMEKGVSLEIDSSSKPLQHPVYYLLFSFILLIVLAHIMARFIVSSHGSLSEAERILQEQLKNLKNENKSLEDEKIKFREDYRIALDKIEDLNSQIEIEKLVREKNVIIGGLEKEITKLKKENNRLKQALADNNNDNNSIDN